MLAPGIEQSETGPERLFRVTLPETNIEPGN